MGSAIGLVQTPAASGTRRFGQAPSGLLGPRRAKVRDRSIRDRAEVCGDGVDRPVPPSKCDQLADFVLLEPHTDDCGWVPAGDRVIRHVFGHDCAGGTMAPLPMRTPGMIVALPPIQTSLPTTVSPRDGKSEIKSA